MFNSILKTKIENQNLLNITLKSRTIYLAKILLLSIIKNSKCIINAVFWITYTFSIIKIIKKLFTLLNFFN